MALAVVEEETAVARDDGFSRYYDGTTWLLLIRYPSPGVLLLLLRDVSKAYAKA